MSDFLNIRVAAMGRFRKLGKVLVRPIPAGEVTPLHRQLQSDSGLQGDPAGSNSKRAIKLLFFLPESDVRE
jgi:hypothetical protein